MANAGADPARRASARKVCSLRYLRCAAASQLWFPQRVPGYMCALHLRRMPLCLSRTLFGEHFGHAYCQTICSKPRRGCLCDEDIHCSMGPENPTSRSHKPSHLHAIPIFPDQTSGSKSCRGPRTALDCKTSKSLAAGRSPRPAVQRRDLRNLLRAAATQCSLRSSPTLDGRLRCAEAAVDARSGRPRPAAVAGGLLGICRDRLCVAP